MKKKSKIPSCGTDIGTHYCVFDYVTMQFRAIPGPEDESHDGWLLITTIDENEYVDGSSDHPIVLTELQTTTEGGLSNLVFLNENGTISIYDFSFLKGKWKLTLNEGMIDLTPFDYYPALPADTEDVACGGFENLLGIVTSKPGCSTKKINLQSSLFRTDKCCCTYLTPSEETVGYGNDPEDETPTIAVTASSPSVEYPSETVLFTAAVTNTDNPVTFTIVSGDGSLSGATDYTVVYTPAETDVGNDIEVMGEIDVSGEQDSATVSVTEEEVGGADEIHIIFAATGLTGSGAAEVLEDTDMSDTLDQSTTIDWTLDATPFSTPTADGTKISGAVTAFANMCSPVYMNEESGLGTGLVEILAMSVDFEPTTFPNTNPVDNSYSILASCHFTDYTIETDSYNSEVDIRICVIPELTEVFVYAEAMNNLTATSTKTNKYEITERSVIDVTVTSITSTQFTINLYIDGVLKESKNVTSTELKALTMFVPFSGGPTNTGTMEGNWYGSTLHQPFFV